MWNVQLIMLSVYIIIIVATCFEPIYRAIFKLIFEHVECTIDNAFSLHICQFIPV